MLWMGGGGKVKWTTIDDLTMVLYGLYYFSSMEGNGTLLVGDCESSVPDTLSITRIE